MVEGGAGAPRAVMGRHLPALDGVRAIAVLGVMAYHLHLAGGGYLGVDLFFVLSGFLITSLLLEEWSTAGVIKLRAFWARRARRLLPALILVVLAVLAYAVLHVNAPHGADPGYSLSRLNSVALWTLLYIANWHVIYIDQALSPLQHTWSLGIEEQFYLIWPLVVIVLLRMSGVRWRRAGLWLCVIGACLSAFEMGLLFHAGYPGRLRSYTGTDTRAFTLLAGAALAFVSANRPQPGARVRAILHVAGPLSAVTLVGLWLAQGRVNVFSTSGMFHGGFQVCAVLAMLLIADARLLNPGLLGWVLSLRPVRWVGTISYGLYLWHVPIIYYMTRASARLTGAPLDLVCAGLAFFAATLSYYLVERPIRRYLGAPPAYAPRSTTPGPQDPAFPARST